MESTRADFYPDWLEGWWKKRALQQLGGRRFEDLQAELEKATQRLSDLFTTDRQARFGNYERDRQLLLAYGLFYFPQTFARIRFPLREALRLRHWQPAGPTGTVRVLDLGAGLGGATLGASLLLQEIAGVSAVKALAVDQSAESLQTLQRLARENETHLPRVQIKTARGDLKSWFRQAPSSERWDLIMASFSLGEAFFDASDETVQNWLKVALKRLRPGGLLLITEPALRETSERIERLRNWIAAEKVARIWAPCPHHQTCPLLAEGKFWCHEVRSWRIPESLSFLNRHLFRSVRDLKFSFLLAGPPPAPGASPDAANPTTMRLVSPVSPMKGRFVWSGCAGDGLRYDYEIQKRDLSRDEQKQMQAIERGDMLHLSESEQLGDPQKRRISSFQALRSWSQTDGREESEGGWESP